MKIYLIGMPGSGKTTLGQQLADALAMPFVDLDKEIEQREGLSIPEIFTQRGEEYFRQIESQVLREWAASTKSFVMATGGGTPCFLNGIETINQTGLSIYLDEPVSKLLERLTHENERPLLNMKDVKQKEEKLTALLSSRLKYYEQARIKVTSPDLYKVMKAIHVEGKG